MARVAARLGWGIRAEFRDVSPDRQSVNIQLRISRLRLAWELLRALACVHVRIGGH